MRNAFAQQHGLSGIASAMKPWSRSSSAFTCATSAAHEVLQDGPQRVFVSLAWQMDVAPALKAACATRTQRAFAVRSCCADEQGNGTRRQG
ncbi:hypothetical protein ACTMU2_23310 [Cupriavidus basilensis]